MNILAATLDAIARTAVDFAQDRDMLDRMTGQIAAVDAGVKAAISLGTLAGDDLTETRDARRRAVDAVDAGVSSVLRRQYALIAAVPEARRSRSTLAPMSAPALLHSTLNGGCDEITHIGRELGEFVEARADGVLLGNVDPYAAGVDGRELVVDGIGRWPLHRIEAASGEDGLSFLLDDGVVIEILARKERSTGAAPADR